MDPRFQTSFIPKKPIIAATGKVAAPINLFSLIATIFFVFALILTGGVFFYKQFVIKQIEVNKQALEAAKGAFEPEVIKDLIRLDSRLEAGKSLIENHVAVTPLFDFLSSVTLKSVRFKDFTFAYLASDRIQVQMKGQAQNYASVALQADLFSEQPSLRDTVLSDMTLEPTGTISFNVVTTVDPSVVSYSALFAPVDTMQEVPMEQAPVEPVNTPLE